MSESKLNSTINRFTHERMASFLIVIKMRLLTTEEKATLSNHLDIGKQTFYSYINDPGKISTHHLLIIKAFLEEKEGKEYTIDQLLTVI